MKERDIFTQENYISRLIGETCTIIMVNGYQMHNVTIRAAEKDALLVCCSTTGMREQLVFLHAVSTIHREWPGRNEIGGGGNG